MYPQRVVDRLFTKVTTEGDCLVSLYRPGSHGYAGIGWSENGVRHTELVHRMAWTVLRGPIPALLTIDHLCFNRLCIKIDHLRLLTLAQNAANNGMARRTHCPHGHEYTPENTRRDYRGFRYCRRCDHR